MLHRYGKRQARNGGSGPGWGDALLSLALPAAVILVGVALSVGVFGGFDAFVGLCLGPPGR